MKKTIIYVLMAAAATLLSCTRTELDPLQGVFPDASLITFTQNTKNDYVKDAAGRKTFNLEWTDGTNVLKTTMISAKYFLGSNTYTIAADNLAKNGNFVAEKTTLNGNPVAGGDIIVERLLNDQYKINGVLFVDANGTANKIHWEGELKYVRDPLPPVGYYYSLGDLGDLSDASGTVAEGVKSTVITLADIETGVFFGQLSLNLDEAQAKTQKSSNKIVDGVYDVKEYATEPFTAGNGFDLSPYVGLPDGSYVIGSYYWDDGKVVTINAGDAIEVYKEDGHTVFETNSGLVIVADPLPIDPNKWDTVDMGEGVKLIGTEVDPVGQTVTVQLATAGLKTPFDMNSEGYYLNLVLYSKDGYLHAGSYEAGAGTPDTFLIGYDVFEPGVELNKGTTLWKVSGANAESRNITEGTVTVVRNDGETVEETTWTIQLATEQVVVDFTGAIPALTSEGALFDDVDPSVLTKFVSASSNLGFGTPTLTLNFTTEDVASAGGVYGGVGYRLSMDIYSADGKLHEGIYTACAEGGNVGPGEFGIGYDNAAWGDWGKNWGTCWWSYDKDVANVGVTKVVDGTVAVFVQGDQVTLMLGSSVINTTYVGPAATGLELAKDEYIGVEINNLLSFQSNVANGTPTVTINMATNGVSASLDPSTWQTVWSGTGYYLATDIYSEEGKLVPGLYKACAEGGNVGPGEFGIGYDVDMWGMHFENWGTCWWTVTDGAVSAQKVLDGIICVACSGDEYIIQIASSTIASARFTGKLPLE